ncbi:hypothetical protein D3C78_1765330 [compost metagenome]
MKSTDVVTQLYSNVLLAFSGKRFQHLAIVQDHHPVIGFADLAKAQVNHATG